MPISEAGEKIEALRNLDLKFMNKDKLESSIAQLAVVNARINKSIGKENVMQQEGNENGVKRRF